MEVEVPIEVEVPMELDVAEAPAPAPYRTMRPHQAEVRGACLMPAGWDDPAYTDPEGYPCSAWSGHNCHTAAPFGATRMQALRVRAAPCLRLWAVCVCLPWLCHFGACLV